MPTGGELPENSSPLLPEVLGVNARGPDNKPSPSVQGTRAASWCSPAFCCQWTSGHTSLSAPSGPPVALALLPPVGLRSLWPSCHPASPSSQALAHAQSSAWQLQCHCSTLNQEADSHPPFRHLPQCTSLLGGLLIIISS